MRMWIVMLNKDLKECCQIKSIADFLCQQLEVIHSSTQVRKGRKLRRGFRNGCRALNIRFFGLSSVSVVDEIDDPMKPGYDERQHAKADHDNDGAGDSHGPAVVSVNCFESVHGLFLLVYTDNRVSLGKLYTAIFYSVNNKARKGRFWNHQVVDFGKKTSYD